MGETGVVYKVQPERGGCEQTVHRNALKVCMAPPADTRHKRASRLQRLNHCCCKKGQHTQGGWGHIPSIVLFGIPDIDYSIVLSDSYSSILLYKYLAQSNAPPAGWLSYNLNR